MIGPGITIRGTLTGDEDLQVEGRIEGAVQISRDLSVAEGARITATVEAASVNLRGRLVGDVVAEDGVVVEPGAVLVGNVTTSRFVLADGAHFKGRVQMDFEVAGAEVPRASTGNRRR